MDFLDELLIQLQDYSQDFIFQFKEIKELDKVYKEKRESLISLDSTLRSHNKETTQPEQEAYTKASQTLQELSEISQKKINIALKNRDIIDSLIGKLDKELVVKKDLVPIPVGNNNALDDEETLIMDVKKNPTIKKKTSVSLIKPPTLSTSMVEEEAVYCFCRLGSFGNMIGCDNEECPIEWFHYNCVGLTEPPRGSWYCPTCALKTTVSR